MFGLLKNKPWNNLSDNLTTSIPIPLRFIFILYAILLPLLSIASYKFEINGDYIRFILNVFALFILIFIPKFLRSGRNLLSLHDRYRKNVFPILYHTVLKFGVIFAVVFFTYTVILISMIILKELTGISNAQEIPDLSYMTFKDIFYNAISAGLTEEVWKVVCLILILSLIKKLAGSNWNNVKSFSLIFTVFFISFLFGWLHSFGFSDSNFSIEVTVQIGIVGSVLSGIYLVTRRISYAIFFHTLFNFVSLTGNANNVLVKDNLTSFIEEYSTVLAAIGVLSLLSFICFILSPFLLRFSKGAMMILDRKRFNG